MALGSINISIVAAKMALVSAKKKNDV